MQLSMDRLYPSASAHIAHYKAGQLGTPSGTVSISDIYEQIRTDEHTRSVTQYIQHKHREGIADSFKSVSKTPYQADKKNLLDAVTFSGNIDRSAGKKPDFHHNGRINLDIDEGNSPEDLQVLRRLIKTGHFPYVEACAYSISGFHNRHLWINAVIEIPEDFQGNYDKLEDLHKRYHQALSHALKDIILIDLECTDRFSPDQTVIRLSAETLQLLKIRSGHQLSIQVGGADDVKRIRYITADPGIVVRCEAKPVKYEDLLKFEAYQEQKRKVTDMEGTALKIVASDTFDFCHQFAEGKGYTYQDGQKQLYLANFCIGANLVGIPEEETRTYILSNIHPVEDGDFIRYPYKAYKDSFAVWKGKVQISQKTFLPMDVQADTFMTFNKYLEDSPDFPKLLDKLCNTDRSVLIVPTGSGKTTTTISTLYDRLKAQFPDKVFIYVSPLTAITQQVGIKTDMQILCEGMTSSRSAIFEDSICTIKSFIDWSERLHLEGLLKDVILVVDELHELITASTYQQTGSLPYIFEEVFKVIGLTATPLTPLLTDYGFQAVKCDRITAPAINIECKRIKKDQLYKTLTAYGNNHRKEKTLYFCNSKDTIEKQAKGLKRKGLNADFFHADVKKKNAETYRHLIEQGTLPDGVDHFFSTKLLGFGTSFKGLDGIVYVTYDRSKDFLDFVQSIARLREDRINVTLILVEPKNENTRKHRLYNFDGNALRREAKQLQKTADNWNRYTQDILQSGIEPLKDSLPDNLKQFIKYNKLSGKYYVDTLRLYGDQYERIIQSCTGEDMVNMIRTMIPNVSFVEGTQEAVISEQDQQIIDQVEQEHQESREADTEALKMLFKEKPDQVLRYMAKHSETEPDLKDKIKDTLPLTIINLENEEAELVDRRFNIALYVTRRYIRLTNNYKDRIDQERKVDFCFLSSYNWKRQLHQLYSLDNIERMESGEDMVTASRQSAKGEDILTVTIAQAQLVSFCMQYQDKEMTAGELYGLLKDKDFFQVLQLNKKTWTEEVKCFFHLHRRRTNKERLLVIGERQTLKEQLTGDILENAVLYRKAV